MGRLASDWEAVADLSRNGESNALVHPGFWHHYLDGLFAILADPLGQNYRVLGVLYMANDLCANKLLGWPSRSARHPKPFQRPGAIRSSILVENGSSITMMKLRAGLGQMQ